MSVQKVKIKIQKCQAKSMLQGPDNAFGSFSPKRGLKIQEAKQQGEPA
jgi:hypothetical protein